MPFHTLPTPPAVFPTFLLPAIPFRRRTSSSDTTATASSASSTSADPFLAVFPSSPTQNFLSGHTSHIRCSRCRADLALTSQIISKGFTGRHGRAYLVAPAPTPSPRLANNPSSSSSSRGMTLSLPNTHTHKSVPRHLVTGMHTVSDISCALCGSVLGWKYVGAEEESQKYKIGKYILETKRCAVSSYWENDEMVADDGDADADAGGVMKLPPVSMAQLKEEDVEFDSQDEDECEDLFAGVWSKQIAMKRRKGKLNLRNGGV